MSQERLSEFVAQAAAELGIRDVIVGVLFEGVETYACHGVTSVDNPLTVDRDTLYELGPVTKTYTATTLRRLVAEGRVELEAPVRRYVPELVLADEQRAAEVAVLNLLNHTSGVDRGLDLYTGDGDDALAGSDRAERWMVERVAEVPTEPVLDPAIAHLLAASAGASSPGWERLTEIAEQRSPRR